MLVSSISLCSKSTRRVDTAHIRSDGVLSSPSGAPEAEGSYVDSILVRVSPPVSSSASVGSEVTSGSAGPDSDTVGSAEDPVGSGSKSSSVVFKGDV